MGMFDSFFVIDSADAELFKNGEGVPMFDRELQTKDLDCNMDTYYIFGSRAYVHYGMKMDREPRHFSVDGDKLAISYYYERAKLSGTIELYTLDRSVKPVLYMDQDGFQDMISELYPWVKFYADFEEGVLGSVKAVEITSREELKTQIGEGNVLLDDDNPIAIRHFKVSDRKNARRRW